MKSSKTNNDGSARRSSGLRFTAYGLPSTVERRQAAAFTLIELLVSMAILMVIVLMLSNLFQQSTRAWDAGLRQTEVGLEARAVINMIQREASKALPDEPYAFSGSEMKFTILNERGEKEQITYAEKGTALERRNKIEDEEPETVQLLDNVEQFYVGNESLLTGFPDLVEIELKLRTTSNSSKVRVYGTNDEGDIVADTGALD